MCSHIVLLFSHRFYSQPSQNSLNYKKKNWKSSYLPTLQRMTFPFIVSNTKKTVALSSESWNRLSVILTCMMSVVIFTYVQRYMYLVIILCVMELLQIEFCIFEYSRRYYQLKHLSLSLKKKKKKKKKKKRKKKYCRYSKLLLTLVVNYKTKTRWLHRKYVFTYFHLNFNMAFIPAPPKTVKHINANF